MPRSLIVILVVCCSLLSVFSTASAQDAAPRRDVSLITELGLPEINLVGDDTTVGGAPKTLDAGWYTVSLQNQTADTEIQVFIIAPPDNVTLDEFLTEANSEDSAPPDWLYEVALAGGPNAYGGQTDAVAVNLTAGEWWFAYDRYSEPAVWEADIVTVTGDTATALDVPDAATVTLREYTFDMPAVVPSGEQIWQVENTGEQPHFFVLAKLPDGTGQDEFMAFLMSMEEGEPAEASPEVEASPSGTALSEENISFVYDSSFVSGGQTMFVQVGIEPGTYAMLCWFPDRDSGAPHVAMGMVNVFTVDQ